MENSKPFFKLLKNVHVFAPEDKGIQDILIDGEKIAAIGKIYFYRLFISVKSLRGMA